MRHKKSQIVRKIVFSCLFTLLLSGCAGQSYWSWQHPEGLNDQIRQQEMAACDALAIREVNRLDYYSHFPIYYPYYDRNSSRHYRNHFYSQYYHFNAHREFQDRRRYFRICMESKGWRKVKNDRQPAN